jgi:hypothetical protein
MNAASLINQTSGKTEFWTPQPIIEAARRTMGGIDLDPASSSAANKRVKAGCFFTELHDGLRQDWFGNVWLNHPFGRIANPLWVRKVVWEYKREEVMAITCITFASTSEAWFQPLLEYPQCFLSPRTNYLLPDGSVMRGVTKGSVVTYLGSNVERFAHEFKSFGAIKILYQPHHPSPPPGG